MSEPLGSAWTLTDPFSPVLIPICHPPSASLPADLLQTRGSHVAGLFSSNNLKFEVKIRTSGWTCLSWTWQARDWAFNCETVRPIARTRYIGTSRMKQASKKGLVAREDSNSHPYPHHTDSPHMTVILISVWPSTRYGLGRRQSETSRSSCRWQEWARAATRCASECRPIAPLHSMLAACVRPRRRT